MNGTDVWDHIWYSIEDTVMVEICYHTIHDRHLQTVNSFRRNLNLNRSSGGTLCSKISNIARLLLAVRCSRWPVVTVAGITSELNYGSEYSTFKKTRLLLLRWWVWLIRSSNLIQLITRFWSSKKMLWKKAKWKANSVSAILTNVKLYRRNG